MKPHRSFGLLTRTLTLTSLAIVVVGMANAIFGSAYSLYFRTPFPFRDMVELMEFLDANPAIWVGESFTHLHDLEHRPALPAFLWYADRHLSGSSGLMPLLVSHAFLAATALLAVGNWAPRFNLKNPSTWVVPAAALAVMFSLINWYNLMWEKQLHVTMSLFFLTVSGYFAGQLSPADVRSSKLDVGKNLLLMAFMAWIATFSFGYGLLVMPIITIHSVLARWPWRRVIYCAAMSIMFVAAYIYFLSLRRQGLTGLTDFSVDPLVMISYVARLLAGAVAATELHTFAGAERETVALIVGLVLLGLYGFGAARLYIQSLWFVRSPPKTQSISLIVTSVCVAIALITYLSRPVETHGLVNRYYIVSTFFILSLPGLFVSVRDCTRRNGTALLGCIGLSSLFIFLSLLGSLANQSQLLHRWHVSAVAAIGADAGVYLPDQNELIGPPLHAWKNKTFEVWEAHRVRLKEHGRYFPFGWRGRNVEAMFDISTLSECFGSVERINPVPGYEEEYVFIGWARLGAMASSNADWIVVTDPAGWIIGLGAPGRGSDNGRKWLEKRFPDKIGLSARNAGIAGYLSETRGTAIHFFVIKDNKACKFTTGYVSG